MVEADVAPTVAGLAGFRIATNIRRVIQGQHEPGAAYEGRARSESREAERDVVTNTVMASAVEAAGKAASAWPHILNLVMSFLGGGLVLAILNWVREARSERRRRQIEYLQRQLAELYGPLHFFAKQNHELIKLHNQHDEAYEKEFIEQKWSGFCQEDRGGKSEPEKAIDVSNAYAEKIRENHARMMEILQRNWGLIDADDCEMFAQFMVDQARNEVEFDEKRVLKIPLGIFKRIGDGNAYTYRQGFVDRIQKKWQVKQDRLKGTVVKPV